MKNRILIIDDDQELNHLLSSYLKPFGFDVITTTHPSKGLELIKTQNPDLLVLDIMLPEKTGFEFCIEIRKYSTLPIIFLTARGDLNDRIVGFDLGGDDYLLKPYEPRELVARIQSLLRRTQGSFTSARKRILRSGELTLDLDQASVSLLNEGIELTNAEFEILKLLMENPGRTLSRDEIFQKMRGSQWDSVDRSVDVVISRIRQKLKDDSRNSQYLKTIWGEGYRFAGEVTHA